MIDESLYREFTRYLQPQHRAGGQELIIGEVLGAIGRARSVLIPFQESYVSLIESLLAMNRRVVAFRGGRLGASRCDVLYFGTPTIVDGVPLFGGYPGWTKQREREWVRSAVDFARAHAMSRVVCGLGSGDISVAERQEDLGGGAAIVAYKNFNTFEDWVLVKDL